MKKTVYILIAGIVMVMTCLSVFGADEASMTKIDGAEGAGGQASNGNEKDDEEISYKSMYEELAASINKGKDDSSSNDNNSLEGGPDEIRMEFIDYTEFDNYWLNGIYRCPNDLEPGNYYELALVMPFPDYPISDNPNDFKWAYYRTCKNININEGDYVNIGYGAILVSESEMQTDLTRYGIYEVGKDISAGVYKIETITDEYHSDISNDSGILGGYQITEGSACGTRIEGDMLFSNSQYIELKDGEYLSIVNAKLTRVD